jgi:hypothetical protein
MKGTASSAHSRTSGNPDDDSRNCGQTGLIPARAGMCGLEQWDRPHRMSLWRFDLDRDDVSSNRHPILAFCLRMIFFGKPVSTPDQVRGRLFPDHALHYYGTGRIEEKRTIA